MRGAELVHGAERRDAEGVVRSAEAEADRVGEGHVEGVAAADLEAAELRDLLGREGGRRPPGVGRGRQRGKRRRAGVEDAVAVAGPELAVEPKQRVNRPRPGRVAADLAARLHARLRVGPRLDDGRRRGGGPEGGDGQGEEKDRSLHGHDPTRVREARLHPARHVAARSLRDHIHADLPSPCEA